MINPLNCVRYILPENIDAGCHKLIAWLSEEHLEIYLIQRESYPDHGRVLTRLTLFHRDWGATVTMELIPIDSTQTLVLIPAPADPDFAEVSAYETKIFEGMLESSMSIRLARMHGDDQKALMHMRAALCQQRHHLRMKFQSELMRLEWLRPLDGNPEELLQYIPNNLTGDRDIEQVDKAPSQDESLVLDLWMKGYTAKQIALRTGRTEKTILNRLVLLRKVHGEQLVPRRRIA